MIYWLKKYWQYVLGVIVLCTATVIFIITDATGLSFPYNILLAIYSAFSLLVLEAGNIPFPDHAAPVVKIILWICYFLAPLLTFSIIFTVIREKLLNRVPATVSGHTIICGMGRNGKQIFDLLKEDDSIKHRIVIVEQNQHNPYGELLEKHRLTWWLKSDFTKEPVLKKAKISKAERIYITTNHDLDNLHTVVNVIRQEKRRDNLKIYCHIGDIMLHNNFCEMQVEDEQLRVVQFFNGYKSITKRLFEAKVADMDLLNAEGNFFVIFGFGRFGQMLYNHIITRKNGSENNEILIVTLKDKLLADEQYLAVEKAVFLYLRKLLGL